VVESHVASEIEEKTNGINLYKEKWQSGLFANKMKK